MPRILTNNVSLKIMRQATTDSQYDGKSLHTNRNITVINKYISIIMKIHNSRSQIHWPSKLSTILLKIAINFKIQKIHFRNKKL